MPLPLLLIYIYNINMISILFFCSQVRYKEGTLSMLEAYEKGQAFAEDNYIVKEGQLASQYS